MSCVPTIEPTQENDHPLSAIKCHKKVKRLYQDQWKYHYKPSLMGIEQIPIIENGNPWESLGIDGYWWSFVGISLEGPGNVL